MYKSLMPDLVSVSADLPRAVTLAARHGFGGVDTSSSALAAPDLDLGAVKHLLEETGVQPGYVSLAPGRIPASDTDWRAARTSLPLVAARAQALGFTRAALVVLPFHETLPFAAAFAEHLSHLNPLTAILDDHGIALALEYVSPLSRRAAYPHAFVHDLAGMVRLCDALDSPHAGVLLDSFHWHCAGESAADIARLSADKIVVVHVNDAPNLPLAEQTVGNRALPGATGVIDSAGFIHALRTIGYDGPITCEPMAGAIAALGADSDEAILGAVSAALDTLFADSGDRKGNRA